MRKKISVILFIACSFFIVSAKPKLAVMSIDDQSGKLSEKVKNAATTLLRTHLSSSGQFIVIDATRQQKVLKDIIKEKKKESYKMCYDDNCQIPLGQALSADTILRSTVTELGGTFSLGIELVDLAKEAVTKAASFEFDGTEKGILGAVKQVVDEITVKSAAEQEKQKELERKKATEKKRIEEEKKKKELEEKRKKEQAARIAKEKAIKEKRIAMNKELKIARKGRMALTWSSLAAGVALSASGVGLLVYSDNKKEEWNSAYSSYLSATNEEDSVKYRKETEDLRDKEKVSKVLGGVFLGTGIGFLLTSIIAGSVSSSAEKKVKKKYDISFNVDPFSRMAVISVNY